MQGGTLCTTFTASQGLLLMLPNLYKIAGELTPTVFHIAARSLASHALSIFCDHSDVMSARGTGFALVASNSVQEAHDFAAITQAVTLRSRIPVLHFFDGFRTSHEVAKIDLVEDDDLRAIPVIAGHYYLVTVPAWSAVVSLDISDPAAPREVSRVTFAENEYGVRVLWRR